ncbi:hypothetical protein LSUB1_G001178 [Lachnellula subtilissima]|uniref:Protein kinase domain-containing protein n=1 Tax=Lachnellula subtilissima TaxID=602034 RepID=A0A8H8S0T7_9HELO|nr:hypothetical protein LSUB1_G001178 [Lachnellula subtilissima]
MPASISQASSSAGMDPFQNMSHTVIDSHIKLDSSWVTVMCRATRFHITVSHKDIRRSHFETENSEMVAKAIDDDDEEDHDVLCEWIVDPCLPYFRENTSNVPKEITFKDSVGFGIRTLSQGHSRSWDYECFPSDDTVLDLPPFSEVPNSKASDLRIVSDTQWVDYMSEIPQKAILSDDTSRFFKPADDKKQLLREVDMHLRIRHAGLQDKIKVANLHSIVVSDDAKMTIGLLLDLIPSTSDSLYSHKNRALASEYHARWKQQITATVRQLHSHGLVWGDVHPGNIVIDTSFNAWVVDFGGGSIVEFVPRKKVGTKAGDWHGVGKILDEWILEKKRYDLDNRAGYTS